MNAAQTTRRITNNPSVIRTAILNQCRGREIPEPAIFAHLCERPDYATGRHDRNAVDSVIDSMLDAGELRSSIIDARETGHGYVPTLRALIV